MIEAAWAVATTATNKSNSERMITPVYLKRNIKVFLGKPEEKKFQVFT